jgi:hypothetical protein
LAGGADEKTKPGSDGTTTLYNTSLSLELVDDCVSGLIKGRDSWKEPVQILIQRRFREHQITWPSVQQDQRNRIRVLGFLMHKMHTLPFNQRSEVREPNCLAVSDQKIQKAQRY